MFTEYLGKPLVGVEQRTVIKYVFQKGYSQAVGEWGMETKHGGGGIRL